MGVSVVIVHAITLNVMLNNDIVLHVIIVLHVVIVKVCSVDIAIVIVERYFNV